MIRVEANYSDHCCKPNLRLKYDQVHQSGDYLEWTRYIKAMASHASTFMKLSGFFSELPPLSSNPDIDAIAREIKPWTDVIFDSFGAQRVMFGSDWPVCNIGGGRKAWDTWLLVVTKVLELRGLSDSEKNAVWGGTANVAYRLSIE